MLKELVVVGVGGFAGAIARYITFITFESFYHKYNFPAGTTIVNLTGSLLIGIALGLSIKFNLFQRHAFSHYIFVTGFLGAFTTFSTFSSDNFLLLLDKNYPVFLINIIFNIFMGIALTAFGYFLVVKFI
ncbi:MAG TPA: CrcB family protein [bacterium]|nr:CrcB family protein [bacterium]